MFATVLVMVKSKQRSVSRRSGGEDCALQPSVRVPSRMPRVPPRSLSPAESDSASSAQGLPPRPRLTFGDFASIPLGARVSANSHHRSSSSSSCARKGISLGGSQAVPLAHSVGSRALSRDGVLPSPSLGAPANSPPALVGHLAVSHNVPGSSSLPGLVHFPNVSSTASCKFLESDVSPIDEKFYLIGFVAGKCPGYNLLSQFIVQNWQYHASLVMHDSGWLVFEFLSESAMLNTLGGTICCVWPAINLASHARFF